MERVTVELLYELPLAVFDEAADSRGRLSLQNKPL